MMTNKVRFNNELEMNVDNGLHGWMEDEIKLVGMYDDMEKV